LNSASPAAHDFSVSHDCVGFLRSAGPKGFTAYDADCQPLGLFAEKQAAVEAITATKFNGDDK